MQRVRERKMPRHIYIEREIDEKREREMGEGGKDGERKARSETGKRRWKKKTRKTEMQRAGAERERERERGADGGM